MLIKNLDGLLALRDEFESEGDWVAVGHVSYLIDRLSEPGGYAQPRFWNIDLSATLH